MQFAVAGIKGLQHEMLLLCDAVCIADTVRCAQARRAATTRSTQHQFCVHGPAQDFLFNWLGHLSGLYSMIKRLMAFTFLLVYTRDRPHVVTNHVSGKQGMQLPAYINS